MGRPALKMCPGPRLPVSARAGAIVGEDGQPWFLEFNSLPGLTPASFMPKEAAAAGMTYSQLMEDIVQQSVRIRRR